MKFDFKASLLLAPLAYSIHHVEEHFVFHFREWRLRYFADNNPLPTELVFIVLTTITLGYILAHYVFETKATARSTLLFLMATQVANAIFHAGGTLVFWDFSPGLITALLLYVPVNFVIARQALQEGWVTPRSVLVLFVLGGVIFTLFEIVGPFPMVAVIAATAVWIGVSARRKPQATGAG